MSERLVTIGVAARVLGIPAWKLRAWERSGLITAERTTSGYRLFSPRDLDRARAVDRTLAGGDRLAALGLAHAGSTPGDTGDAGVDHGAGADGRESAILRRLAHGVRHTDDLHAVIDLGLQSALDATGSVIGSISLADFSRQQYVLVSSTGLSPGYTRGIDSWKLHEGLAGRAFGLREPLVIHDLQVDRRVAREIVRAEGLRGYVCVPLLRGQRRLGILQVFSRTAGRFDAVDIGLLETVAAAISPILEISDLERHLQSTHDERTRAMREWSNQLSSERELERTRVSERLHDIASAVAGGMSPAEAAGYIAAIADDLAAGRGVQIDLIPLVEANIVQRLADLHGIEFVLTQSGWPATLPSVVTSRLYLLLLTLAEEAASVARSRVQLSLSATDAELTVTIADDRESLVGRDDGDVALSAEVMTAVRHLGGQVRPGSTRAGALVAATITVGRGQLDALGDTLTSREREVLEALRLGATNRDIAAELSISSKTLQNHLTALYRKLDVTSRAEAIRYAESTSAPARSGD